MRGFSDVGQLASGRVGDVNTVTFISGNNDHVDLTAANEWKA